MQMKYILSLNKPKLFFLFLSAIIFSAQLTAQEMSLNDELAVWKIVRNSNDPAELRVFLDKFSDGIFAKVAADKLRALEQKTTVIKKALLIDTNPADANIELLNENSIYHYGIKMPLKQYQVKISAAGYETSINVLDLNAQDNFYITLEKQESTLDTNEFDIGGVTFHMKDIPAGRFLMGSSKVNSEKPVHQVSIKAFQLMETEVTWTLYQQCIDSGKCDKKDKRNRWAVGERPAMSVSWNEITHQFIPWISQQTGKIFRLPSESEWEYAARAGSTSNYSWGNKINCQQARFNGGRNSACYYKDKNRDYVGTREVKSYQANKFGLYDMHGNAAEWVQDCQKSNYSNAPVSGEANLAGDCEKRMVRGGSWFSDGSDLRVSKRDRGTAKKVYREIGFRLAISN
jgi:formylglycine-generating enzyme required for sulfatase activity